MSYSFFSQRPPSSPLENDVIKLCLMLSCDSEITKYVLDGYVEF